MKTILKMLIMLLTGIVVGAFAMGRLHNDQETNLTVLSSVSAGPSIEAVRSLAVLTTTQVTVSDVQLTELRGYTGASRAALLVRGDFTLGTDLSKAVFERVDGVRKHAVLVLPLPVASNPRVDLGRTKLVCLASDGLWELVPGTAATTSVTNAAYADAQRLILQASRGAEWVGQSEHSAERLLACYFGSIGWTVAVKWSAP